MEFTAETRDVFWYTFVQERRKAAGSRPEFANDY